MQLRFPFLQALFEEPRDSGDGDEPAVRIHFVRMRRARRYVMRVRPDGDLRVTIPRGGSKAEALRFAERHMAWAARQRASVLEGRRPAAEDNELRVCAVRELPPQIHALAARLGLTLNRVTIRNQRSRWGSCSSRGSITLNFRLMLMPPSVREYVLVHELMHLKQPNHSIRFWRLVEAACPGFRDAEKWLKAHGTELF
ncbi:MAG: SprT family zinc-dependent metalloprotease [Vicinamibacterales bacterium]